MSRVLQSVPMDAALDQFACRTFMYDRMAPRLSASDVARVPRDPSAVQLSSRIRLVTRHAARLAIEGEVACLYTSTTNSRIFHVGVLPSAFLSSDRAQAPPARAPPAWPSPPISPPSPSISLHLPPSPSSLYARRLHAHRLRARRLHARLEPRPTMRPTRWQGDEEPVHVDFDLEAAPALEKVLTAYPKFVCVAKLPGLDDSQRLDVARALVESRLVMVKEGM